MTQSKPSRRLVIQSTIGLAAALALSGAWAQGGAWPTKPVRLIVGFPGGSSPDLMARTIAEPLAKALGQPVVVENRPGAGGNVAADLVSRATDDHTLGLMINGNLTIAKILNPATTYDPLKDLQPVSLLATAPLVLAAAASVPGDVPGMLAAARAAGGKWNYGTPGIGTVAHIGMELLKSTAGIEAVHVPYQGNPQVITAMVAGDVQLSLLPPGLAMAQVSAGKLKAVGVTSLGRSSLVPNVPSVAEGGIKGFQLEIWNAVAAPNSLPKPVVSKVSGLLADIVRDPEIRQRIFTQGWQVAGTSPEGLGNRIKADTTKMAAVIQKANIKPQ